jgi:hypothetical protein
MSWSLVEKERGWGGVVECVCVQFYLLFPACSAVPSPSHSFILTFISQTLASKQTENNSCSENKVLGKIWLVKTIVRILNASEDKIIQHANV